MSGRSIPCRTSALRARQLALALASALAIGESSSAIPVRAASAAPGVPAHFRGLATQRNARAPASPSGIVAVTNCNDNGSGSLREAIDNLPSGGIVDMTALTCSTITLTSGEISELLDSLTLVGPGPERLTIQGIHTSPVIEQVGPTGTLSIYGLTIANGRYAGPASIGGCIYAEGSLTLYRAVVSGCEHANDTSGAAILGGAIVAYRLYLLNSTIAGNTIDSPIGPAYGGGAWVWQRFYAYGSTVSDNAATGYRGNTGGIAAYGDVSIKGSTISGNTAMFNAGLALFAHTQSEQFAIIDSTISGNVATNGLGGIGTNASTLIANTTIAFNREGGNYSGGLFVGNDATVRLVSSIVSDNYSGGSRRDISGTASARIIGLDDLVRVSLLAMPPGTIFSDPELGPLAYNGGATKTHALSAASPALDGGNVNYSEAEYDQRNLGYARIVGAAPDIGAYERQTTDVVHTITSCADSGSGSVRDALDQAISGDTLDLSSLACGTITLTSGALEIPAGNLILRGPGADRLTIDGGNVDRVVHHTGAGTLYASGLTFAHGSCSVADGCQSGGCIQSDAGVHLKDAVVTSCHLAADNGYSDGGGIYSDRVVLDRTTISNSSITGNNGHGYGGGVWAFSALIRDSTISGNQITTSGSSYGSVAGGIGVGFALDIERSTISGNTAQIAGGVLFSNDNFGARPLSIVDSTISGNAGGGIFAGGFAEIFNSTLTLNTPTTFPFSGAGLLLAGTAHIDSTIAFGNTGPGNAPLDIGSTSNGVLAGANDLIGVSGLTVPHGTISANPMLGPLADNGGPTLTHALGPGSPAIDVGNNNASLTTDQRGNGFPRVVGGGPDIGAFESGTTGTDAIFANGFDP